LHNLLTFHSIAAECAGKAASKDNEYAPTPTVRLYSCKNPIQRGVSPDQTCWIAASEMLEDYRLQPQV
jgi:hypothetical protein